MVYIVSSKYIYISLKINNEYLSNKLVSHGVPQGSVLGPIYSQFICYL